MDLTKYAKENETIREHTDKLQERLIVLKRLGYVKDERIYRIVYYACEYHDYGKVNDEFQKRIKTSAELKKKIRFNPDVEIAHNILSAYFVRTDIEDYEIVLYCVLYHHNYCRVLDVIKDKKELINNLLSNYKDEIITIKSRLLKPDKRDKILLKDETIISKGLLHRCDYSASADIPIEYPADFLNDKMQAMLQRWRIKKPDAGWNEMQQFCLEHANDNIIVTAQTGMGKTEAGLLWIGNNKGFFILPLKTAINAIYERVKKDVIQGEKLDERIGLLHSDTQSYYAFHDNENKADAETEDKEYDFMDYYSKTKALSMPLTISTLDQLFDFVFKYWGYEMKLATLSYSKIVIDEIQMYSADLLAYLIYGIQRITRLGGKVAVVTATLPPFIRDELKNAGFGGNVVESCFTNELIRHNVKVYENEIDCGLIAQKYNDNACKNKPNKILVVCNTVNKAQEIYRLLREEYDIDNIYLLHNKFTRQDRSKKEEEIIKFGDTKNTSVSGIWVATSIVEASLDIDFDVLFTELSDLNGLFQRLGRCNRKGVKSAEEYNCFVFTKINPNLIKYKENGKGFIDSDLHNLSKEALKKVDGILTEKDKVRMLDESFTTEKIAESTYYKEYKQYMCDINNTKIGELDVSKFRNIFTEDVIPQAVYEEHREEINDICNKLENKEYTNEEKIRNVNIVNSYMVSLEKYNIQDLIRKGKIVGCISLGSNRKIKIVKCSYDAELGYRKYNDNDVEVLIWD